ncbi:hypothetical protein CRYUN_Cryun26dG0044500 [Craigia yunnanensis]
MKGISFCSLIFYIFNFKMLLLLEKDSYFYERYASTCTDCCYCYLWSINILVLVQFYNAPTNDFQTKLVLKPLSPERRWKFAYEPIHQDIRLLSKKIPVTKFLNLQVGVGHNFKLNATGWKWKLTTCFGGDGISRIRNKTTLGLVPGLDFRFGWKADYVLPEITGALGTDEPLFNMNSGRLQASLDRVEAIVTHSS